MAKKRLTPQDRIALDNWNELVASVREHSDINPTDTETEIRQRRERLEKNDEEGTSPCIAPASPPPSTKKPPGG